MNEQNRLRLERIAARHAKSAAQGMSDSEADEAFLAAFARVRDEVLRPVMAEIGVQLKASGYAFRISPGGEEGAPAIDFQILIPDRGDSKDTIRFFARKDAARGWQVIAELELKRSPVELTRFETTEEIAHDVAEQLIVDAVEQMFASTTAPPQDESTVEARPPEPAGEVVAQESEHEDSDVPEQPPPCDPVCAPDLLAPDQAPAPLLPPLVDAPEMRWARWAGAQDVGGKTAEVNVEALRRSLLPFVKGPPSPGFPPPPVHAAQVPAVRAAAPPEDDGHGTVMLQNVVFGPALPFVQSSHAGDASGPPAVQAAEPERHEPPAPPPPDEEDGHETVMLKNVAIFGASLPFMQPPHAGDAAGAPAVPATAPERHEPPAPPPPEEDDGHATVMINRDAAFGPALPFMQPPAGPPGKRLVRFDSQTGKPLPEPIWVDVTDPGKRER